MAKTLKDIQKMIEENGIQMVDFKLTDIDGRWRHLSIPAERLTESTMEYGIGFDGSNYGYAPVENSDMVFIPVLDSAVIDRYMSVPTLSMIGDVKVIALPHNKPFDQYPRNVAIRALEYMEELGVADKMVIGPEYEFSIFDKVQYRTANHDMGVRIKASQAAFSAGLEENNNGYQLKPKAGYHNPLPTDVYNDLRSSMCLAMADFGVEVKYHHPEVGGSGQMEIEVELGEMLKLADDTMSAKYVIKNEAVAQGMTKKGYAESEKSYADALAIACNKLPYESDFNEVIEEAFALVGLITKIEPDPKKPKRAGNVYIDLGTNHGVRKNQWFDVFLVKDGNVSDRIATLHLDKAEATYSICKAKKDKEQLLSLWNNNSNGAKFAVVSRMESNIFKKLEKALDFVTNIIDAY